MGLKLVERRVTLLRIFGTSPHISHLLGPSNEPQNERWVSPRDDGPTMPVVGLKSGMAYDIQDRASRIFLEDEGPVLEHVADILKEYDLTVHGHVQSAD